MLTLNKRMQILLDERRYRWLKERANSERRSIGEVVRELIDREAGPELDQRAQACANLLSAEPVTVGDWDEIEREIENAHADALPIPPGR